MATLLAGERGNGWIERNLGQAERIHPDASGQGAEIPFASQRDRITERSGFQA